MLPQKKPNPWSCLATSFAMVLGVGTGELFSILGHDGSQRINSRLPDPLGRRGIHIQECIYVAMSMGKSVTPVELAPQIHTPVSEGLGGINTLVQFPCGNWKLFTGLIETTQGVITGRGRSCNHAVAYDHNTIFEPDTGVTYPYSQDNCEQRGFYTQCLWIVR